MHSLTLNNPGPVALARPRTQSPASHIDGAWRGRPARMFEFIDPGRFSEKIMLKQRNLGEA
jgi:hypothetical protein